MLWVPFCPLKASEQMLNCATPDISIGSGQWPSGVSKVLGERDISAANICSHLRGGQPNSRSQTAAWVGTLCCTGTGESSAPEGPRGAVTGEAWGDWGRLASAQPACPVANSNLFHFYPFLKSGALHYSKGKELASCGRGDYFRLAQLVSNLYALQCFSLMLMPYSQQKKATKMVREYLCESNMLVCNYKRYTVKMTVKQIWLKGSN